LKKIETLQFRDGPLADLIGELEAEAGKWCKENCLYYHNCFDDERGGGAFHVEQIEKCRKIPKLHKLYWRAKSENISAIAPLIVYKEEDDQPKKN